MKNKKICFIIAGLGVGGAENVVIQLANSMSLDNDVTIVSITDDLSLKFKLAQNISVVVHDVKSSISNLIAFYAYFRKNKFDIVHAHMYHANLFSRLIKLINKKLFLINSIHNTLEIRNKKKRALVNILYRITDRYVDCMTNVSLNATQQTLADKITKSQKISTIYNGVDFATIEENKRVQLRLKKKNYVIITVASLTEQKGIDNAINAISELVHTGINVEYHIIGQGRLDDDLSALITSLNMQDHIFLHGVSNNVTGLIKDADLFLLPSRWEGFGLVILEAVACNINIAATRCDGPLEILGPDYKHLCQPDSVNALINVIKNCYHDNTIRYDGNAIKAKFQLSKMIENYNKLYSQVN